MGIRSTHLHCILQCCHQQRTCQEFGHISRNVSALIPKGTISFPLESEIAPMVTALLLQKEFYPVLVLNVTESLPKSTVIPAGQTSFSLQAPLDLQTHRAHLKSPQGDVETFSQFITEPQMLILPSSTSPTLSTHQKHCSKCCGPPSGALLFCTIPCFPPQAGSTGTLHPSCPDTQNKSQLCSDCPSLWEEQLF